MAGREWTLVVEAPCTWLTANDRRHEQAQARLVKQWRGKAYAAAMVARLPVGLDWVRIDVEARFRGRAPVRDTDNLRPTVKAVIDGLGPARDYRFRGRLHHAVGHGLIPDDNDRHLDGPHLTIGPRLDPKPGGSLGHLILTIKELARDEDPS